MDHVSPLRVRLLLGVVALFLSMSAAIAQDAAALPQSSPAEPMEPVSPTPTPAGAATPIPPPQIIPPDVLPMPDASVLPGTTPPSIPTIQQLDEELKPKVISPAADEYRKKIEYRKLRNQVQNDPAVKAALAASERARTDLDKRALLGSYINVFFDKIVARTTPEMKVYVNARRAEQLGSLPQPRVRPTPTPAATPKPNTVAAKATTTAPPPAPALPVASPTPVALPTKSP